MCNYKINSHCRIFLIVPHAQILATQGLDPTPDYITLVRFCFIRVQVCCKTCRSALFRLEKVINWTAGVSDQARAMAHPAHGELILQPGAGFAPEMSLQDTDGAVMSPPGLQD